MVTYTGVADPNGDFTIPFTQNYSGGQKVTVTAEKDGAQKSIELYAPSDLTGGGFLQYDGNLTNFPLNIGNITLSGISGSIAANTFSCDNPTVRPNLFSYAKSLTIPAGITSIGGFCFAGWSGATNLTFNSVFENIPEYAFSSWYSMKNIVLPEGIKTIAQYAFNDWNKCEYLTLPSTILSIGSYSFAFFSKAIEITCLAVTPPTIRDTSFYSLRSACIFKVPAGSVDAYKAAPNWSTYAARIQAI